MKNRAVFVDKKTTISETIGIISKSESVIAVRLHMLIFGAVASKPVLGVNYDPKVKSFMDSMGLDGCLDPEEIAKGDANKVFIPFDATTALSTLGAMKDIVKEDKK